MNDAQGATGVAGIINVLDNLIYSKKVRPVIVALVPFVGNRMDEYLRNPDFQVFLAKDVVEQPLPYTGESGKQSR